MDNWLFDAPPNVAVITTCHVLDGTPILFVSHDEEDGAWQFHDGQTVRESDARVISLKRIIEIDSSVRELADLPLGWIAFRKNKKVPWQRCRNQS